MKNVSYGCIGLAAAAIIVAIISRLILMPVLGLGSKAIIGGAAVLLLFAIAINTLKKD